MQNGIRCLFIESNELPIPITIKSEELNTKMFKQLQDDTYIIYSNIIHTRSQANRIVDKDIIYGNFFVVNYDDELKQFRSLKDEQIKLYSKIYGKESIKALEDRIIEKRIKFKMLLRRVH